MHEDNIINYGFIFFPPENCRICFIFHPDIDLYRSKSDSKQVVSLSRRVVGSLPTLVYL